MTSTIIDRVSGVVSSGGISSFLPTNGTSSMLADLPMGGFKGVNAADGVAATDLATLRQVNNAVANAFIKAGGVAGTSQDNTAIINNQLATTNVCVIPAGDYRVDGTVIVGYQQKLILQMGASLTRYSAFSALTDPVVWGNNYGFSILGEGPQGSAIITQNASPRGVVRLGHKDMITSANNVLYGLCQSLRVQGKQTYGSGSDIGIYMPNPQLGGFASYFHTVRNIQIINVNTGLLLDGWANANTLDDIIYINCGNRQLHIRGAQENRISNQFGHIGGGAVDCLTVEAFDNTVGAGGPVGGSLHTPVYNCGIQGLIFEPGGTARALVITGGQYNRFYIQDNTIGTSSLFSGCELTNDIRLISGQKVQKLNVGALASFFQIGTVTIKINFLTAISVTGFRCAHFELNYSGMDPGFATSNYSKYFISIVGRSDTVLWALGTGSNGAPLPNKIFGDALTITQTAADTTSITITVAGAGVSQQNAITLIGASSNSLSFTQL